MISACHDMRSDAIVHGGAGEPVADGFPETHLPQPAATDCDGAGSRNLPHRPEDGRACSPRPRRARARSGRRSEAGRRPSSAGRRLRPRSATGSRRRRCRAGARARAGPRRGSRPARGAPSTKPAGSSPKTMGSCAASRSARTPLTKRIERAAEGRGEHAVLRVGLEALEEHGAEAPRRVLGQDASSSSPRGCRRDRRPGSSGGSRSSSRRPRRGRRRCCRPAGSRGSPRRSVSR